MFLVFFLLLQHFTKLPLSQVKANWIVFPPTPQKASTMTSHRHLSAICSAIFSGVTENQPSENKKSWLNSQTTAS